MNDTAPDPRDRRRTAFHEAGHAVVGWALGLKVEGLRLIDDQNAKAKGGADIQTADHLSFVDQIAVAMGGRYGAQRSGVDALHDMETINDHVHALNVTTRAFHGDDAFGEVLYRAGCDRARKIVEHHAALVAMIAGELERRGEFSADEIGSLFAAQ